MDLSDLSATRVDLDASGEPLFSYGPADATYWNPSITGPPILRCPATGRCSRSRCP